MKAPSTSTKRREGRSVVYMLPGAWWGMRLHEVTGMKFGELEECIDRLDSTRSAKGNTWGIARFAKAKTALQFDRADHRLLRRYASTLEGAGAEATEFMSITWDEMFQAIGTRRRRPFDVSQVDRDLMKALEAHERIRAILPTGIVLTRAGAELCAQTRHIDALGLLLMQRRLRSAPLFNDYEVFGIRQWLGTARRMFAFRANNRLFLDAFQQTYPELGPLTGKDGVCSITDDASLLKAWYTFDNLFREFGQLEILWHSPFAPKRTDICVVSELDESPPCWIDQDVPGHA